MSSIMGIGSATSENIFVRFTSVSTISDVAAHFTDKDLGSKSHSENRLSLKVWLRNTVLYGNTGSVVVIRFIPYSITAVLIFNVH